MAGGPLTRRDLGEYFQGVGVPGVGVAARGREEQRGWWSPVVMWMKQAVEPQSLQYDIQGMHIHCKSTCMVSIKVKTIVLLHQQIMCLRCMEVHTNVHYIQT